MRGRIGAGLLALCSAAMPVHAADDGGVTSPLSLGSGSRAMGLGRTGVAFAADADALFWNAARLAVVEHAGLSLFRTGLYADGAAYNAAFVAYPSLDVGTFALGFQRLDVSGIERRDDRNQQLGTFGNSESSLMLGYGRRFGRQLTLGTSLRYVQQNIDAASDASLGLDAGLAVETSLGRGHIHRLGFGVNFQNLLAPRLQLTQTEVADPRNVKIGGAYVLAPVTGPCTWMLAADVDFVERANARLGAGVEMTYREMLALRAGIDRTAPTFGVGISWRHLRFDYALATQAGLERDDRFSLQLRLGSGVAERRLVREQEREAEVSTQLARQLEEREQAERVRARSEGEAALVAQRFDDALRAFRRALALDPEDAVAQAGVTAAERELALAQATALLQNGAVAEAAAALQMVVERWPDETRAVHALEEARTALEASADRGRQVQALLKQALGAVAQNDLVAADGALQELLRLEPAHEVALELAERVRSSRDTQGTQVLAQARVLAGKADYDGALERLAEARRLLGSGNELARLNGEWRAARDGVRQSEDTSARVLPPGPRPASGASARRGPNAQQQAELQRRYQAGLEAFERGDFQSAIRGWRAVWVEWPEHPSVAEYLIKAYLYEGIALYSNGKYEAAIELCNRVLEIDAHNAKAKRYLQRMLEEKAELQQLGGEDGSK